jgi:hypothetical protein
VGREQRRFDPEFKREAVRLVPGEVLFVRLDSAGGDTDMHPRGLALPRWRHTRTRVTQGALDRPKLAFAGDGVSP